MISSFCVLCPCVGHLRLFIVLTLVLLEKAGAALQWPMIRVTALGLGALIFASTHEAGH